MAIRNDLENWHDLDSNYRRPSLFTDTGSGSRPTPDSSIAGSTGCENIHQAPASDEITNFTVAVPQNDLVITDDCGEELKHYCMHPTHPEDDRPTYTAIKELKRHQKEHDPEAILWHCGCCQNLGDKYEPKVRKDKVQNHLRNRHEKRKSRGNKWIQCQAEGCYTLFTAASCLDQHWRKTHAGQLEDISSRTTTDGECNCNQSVGSEKMHESRPSGSNKRRATSPLESNSKQGRPETAAHQNQCSELVPRPMSLHNSSVSTTNSSDSRLSADFCLFPLNDFSLNSMNESRDIGYYHSDPQWFSVEDWPDSITSLNSFYNGAANMNYGPSMPSDLPLMNSSHTDFLTPPFRLFRLFLEDSKPADFLAIRKTQAFQDLVVTLRRTSKEYLYPPIDAITYNPKKEILTLTAYSKSKVEKAMTDLRLLTESFSKSRGRIYLVTSHPSTSRALLVDSSSFRASTSSGTTKTYPVVPKDYYRLVQIWFKSILPALPKILSERLGGIYSVSLIRRGQSELSANPCIQIGSPCVPDPATQKEINDQVDKMWEKNGLERIPMRFIEGSIKKLDGADNDDGRTSADVRHLDFNYNRPYWRPGMGASVGLLGSDKLSATLGGYVLIDGEKYLLTSEHFVTNARTQAETNGDCDTLISPSREDLTKFENNLKQNKRDADGKINLLVKEQFGDNDYPENVLSDPNLSNELRDAISKSDNFQSLLDQVTWKHSRYAVGTVKKLSLGTPRRHSISMTLAQQVGLRNDELKVNHSMDWALIITNHRTAQTGENRHKYRSNEDAIKDTLCVDESNRDSQSGDVIYETCDAEAGHIVYYVGQRSKHRRGLVSLPVLDGSSGTLVWGIMGLDGQAIPCSDVAGDSGAWVIREAENKLMGQVHSFDQGQVLFTPIDVIFADLEERCGEQVSLPPRPPGSNHTPSTITAIPLCSIPHTPRARAYNFNLPARVEPITASGISPIKTTAPEARPLESPIVITNLRSTNITHSQRSSFSQCASPSSLPTLMNSPLSSVTSPDSPKSPQSSGKSHFTSGQVNVERLLPMSLPNVVGESTMSEISDLSLDDEIEEDHPVFESKPYAIQFQFQSPPGTISSTRTSTWPATTLGKSQVIKARLRNHAVPYSARAVLDRFARSARRIEDVSDDIETGPNPSSSSEHGVGTLPISLGDARQRDGSFIPEGCNVAAA